MNEDAPRISRIPRDRVIDFDLLHDAAMRRDIFKRLGEVRTQAPSIAYAPNSGGWLVFGEGEIRKVLMDGATFSSSHLGGQAGQDGPGFIPLSIDPPDHTPWRRLLNHYFGPSQIQALEPLVREWAERLIGEIASERQCDFVRSVAEPMPVSIFMILMGLPLDRFDEFRGWVVRGLSPADEQNSRAEQGIAHQQIRAMIDALIEERRRAPRDDLISKLLAEQIEGRPITKAEMMSICYLLFLAGLDTVTNAMAFGMRHLAQHPEMQTELRQDPSAIPGTIEELLRLYTFVNTMRVAKRDVELDGMNIEAGDLLWCVLWSGSNPAEPEAGDRRHMAFGAGPHFCLGLHLARLELKLMFETWFARMGNATLAPDETPAMRSGAVMTISRLLLKLEPRIDD